MDELLRIHMLTVELPTTAGWVRPVNEVTLCIAPGEALGLVGESGSGKTMLSLAMMGLLPPGARVSGEAFLNTADGQPKNLTNLNEPEWREVRGREIAMIFQEPMTSLNPVLRIGTQIEEAVWAHEPGLPRSVVNRRDCRPRTSRHAGTRSAREAISAPTFRGPAATRHDRHGAGRAPQAADCR